MVTNEHVIRGRLHRPDVPVNVMVSLGRGQPAAEAHTSFIPSMREYLDDGNGYARLDSKGQPIPRDPLQNVDLALIRLSAASAKRAVDEGKVFVSWPDEIGIIAQEADTAFRGYAKNDVDLIPGGGSVPNHLVGDGYTLFSHVVRIEGTRIVLDSKEAKVIGCGSPQASRDLHGISGAGVFDDQQRLVAVVYGGDPVKDEVWACPVQHLEPLLEAAEVQS